MSPYPLLIALYLIFFAFLAWQRFHLALALLFFLLPTYLIRFHLGPLPTTLLEVMIWIIIITWVIKEIGARKSLISKNLSLSIAVGLFLTAATISVFTSVDVRAALGEWKAFYVEPFLLFLVFVSASHNQQLTISNRSIVNCQLLIVFALILSGLATSLLAIYQHYTGFLVPAAFWENGNSYRVTAWYGFPNSVGLYLAPLVPLAIYLLYQSFVKIKDNKSSCHVSRVMSHAKFVSNFLFLISAPLTIIFAKSTGALIGLAAGLGFLLILYKKTRWWSIVIGLISLIGLISPISPFRQELLLQNRSGQIRVAMWGEAVELLKERPILGAGLASYQERVQPYHTTVNNEGIEIFHHPHNIFLTMYINLGLLGLISFIWILVWFYQVGWQNLKPITYNLKPVSVAPFLLASMTVIVTHGLVDSPYIKNDLAILFWILIAFMLLSSQDQSNNTKLYATQRN